jgi:pyruvate/2-oxoglutarate dehydrogenase complex dihydrolipoamide dehydrogenase (E3) component
MPPVSGLADLDGLWTNREATAAHEVPASLIVLGGGPVGVEIAQAFGRMGVSVTLVEADERLLPGEAPEVGDALADALGGEGTELHLGAFASRAERRGMGFVLSLDDGGELEADRLLVATGRSPRVRGLGLERVGIDPAADGIAVDERLPPTACGRSATRPGSCPSPTSASTRDG